MKCLLTAINAKYIHSNLAVYSLKAYGDKYCSRILSGEEGKLPVVTELGEYTINHQKEDILKDIYRRRPDMVAFSCYIWNMDYVTWLIREVPKVLPGVKLWLGGPEVSYDSTDVLKRWPTVEGVMMGEGEETFCRLMAYYAGEEAGLDEIPGIAYRLQDGSVKANPWAPLISMDRIPFPYNGLEDFENRIIYYESSRGCPFSCSYCLSSIDKSVRFRSLELVLPEIQFFLDHRVPQVKFVDRTFNCRRSHSLAIWRYLLEHDNGVTNFHFEITSDLLDEEELLVLSQMRPALVQLEIGVQSTNPMTIEAIKRRMDLSRVKACVDRVNGFGNIHQHLDLIAGLPYEDYDSFGHSFDDVYHMRPEQLQLGFLKVLKGSEMRDRAEDYGLVYWDEPPYEVLSTNWLDYGKMLRLKELEDMVEVFYNSGQFRLSLTYLETFFDRPFHLYEALAQFYREQGLAGFSHSRMARYEQLFQFAAGTEGTDQELFSQILVCDLYLRENVKNRPGFAGESRTNKEWVRDFYRKEAKNPRRLLGYEGFDERQMAKMTHMEAFTCDVEASAKAGKMVGEGQYLLFDYRFREPLGHNAKVIKL